MSDKEEYKIIKAESGPKRAERPPLSYVKTLCVNVECERPVYFFRMETYACCLSCGIWTSKPINSEALTI